MFKVYNIKERGSHFDRVTKIIKTTFRSSFLEASYQIWLLLANRFGGSVMVAATQAEKMSRLLKFFVLVHRVNLASDHG